MTCRTSKRPKRRTGSSEMVGQDLSWRLVVWRQAWCQDRSWPTKNVQVGRVRAWLFPNQLFEQCVEFERHGAWLSVADDAPVELDGGYDFRCTAGEEALVGHE